MSSTIDQQFIEYIVKSLVSNPEAVSIERRIDEKGVLLELTVDPEDLGRVIGKRGATAQSLRTLLRALGTKQDARYNLKIIDPTGGFGGRRDNDDSGYTPRDNRNDDHSSDDNATPARVIDTDEPEKVMDDEVQPEEEEQHSDRIKEARKELADLDDLDV